MRFSFVIREEVERYSFDFDNMRFAVDIYKALDVNEQFVDPKALGRALSNLLSNATKYANSAVKVSYCRENDRLCLPVDDDGAGISPEDYEKVLEPFSQLSNNERNMDEGHGLGLSIASQIAKWHRGHLVIRRSDLGGASITLCWSDFAPSLHHKQGAKG